MADWVSNVGGDSVDVFSLVPVGADPHTFQPGAKDVARIAEADLVLSVGLGLEGAWLHDLLENAARDESAIIEMGEIVDPIEFAQGHADEVEVLEEISHVVHEVEEGEISPDEGIEELKELLAEGEEEEEGDHEGEEELPEMVLEIIAKVEDGEMAAADAIEAIEELTEEGEDEHADHGHGLEDPHFWFDPLRVKIVVNDIAARLSVLDPERGSTYTANASAYNAKLDELHSWTEEQVGIVPEDRRLLVTSHDSYGYFANLYGFEVVGVSPVDHHRRGAVGGRPGGPCTRGGGEQRPRGVRGNDGERASGKGGGFGVGRGAGPALLWISRSRRQRRGDLHRND